MDDILKIKEELADSYIKEFKKELGFLKGSVFGIFERKIKGLILSNKELGDNIDSIGLNFFEKLILDISPRTAERIFKFIKEKQEKLQKAKTKNELNDLQDDVVSENVDGTPKWNADENNNNQNNGPDDAQNNDDQKDPGNQNSTGEDVIDNQDRNAVAAGLTTAGVGGAAILGIDQYGKSVDLNEIKKLNPGIDKKTTKELFEKMSGDFEDLSKNLETQASNPKISKIMRNNIQKSAKEFEKASKNLDKGSIDAFDAWRKLGNKLPDSIVKSISPKESKLLLSLGDDVLDEIKNLDNIDDIKNLLKQKGINGIGDETIKVLKNAANPGEMKLMVNCLSQASKIRNVLRAIKSVALLDLIFLGFDIWMYNDTMNEADMMQKVNGLRAESMRDRAKLQLRVVGVGGTALSIFATCLAVSSLGGPIGIAIGAVVGGSAVLVNYIIEKQHEKRDAYLKNEEDYKREYRSEIKQSVLQVIAAKEWNFNSQLRKKIEKQRGSDIQTVNDGLRALIWLEEYENPDYYMLKNRYDSGLSQQDFLKNLDPDSLESYNKQNESINKQIDIRMEYIKNYVYQNNGSVEYNSFVSDIENGKGISALDQIIAKSRVYMVMKDNSDKQFVFGCEDIDDYKNKYLEKLKLENPIAFDKCEKYISNMDYLYEIYAGVLSYENILDQNKDDPLIIKDYEKMKQNVDFIKKYYTYKTLGLTYEEANIYKFNYAEFDYNYIDSILMDIDNINLRPSYDQEKVKDYLNGQEFTKKLDSEMEVSDSLGQNIIYRIAREIHGYGGNNDMVQLIGFFVEAKKNNLGIYYDHEWKINVHKTRIASNDVSFSVGDFENKDGYEKIMKYLGSSYENFDSVLDHVDESVNIDYKNKINEIIDDEMSYKKPEVKKNIEQEILDYIKNNSNNLYNSDSDTGYLDLPYYMIIKAKKSGIGNLEKFMFKYENNSFFALSSGNYITEKIDFGQTKIQVKKEYMKKLRESLSDQEMKYINYVDVAYKKLEQLRSIQGNGTKEDELDIPIEYERSVSQMAKKRNDFKQSLLYLDPTVVESRLNDNYDIFYDYFESMYMGLLSVVDKNIFSNDIDDSNYMSQAYNRNGRKIVSFDKTNGDIKLLKGLIREGSEEVFYELLNRKIYEDKTLKEIFEEDEYKGQWVSKQIVKSILESVVVNIDDNGNIHDIENGYLNYVDKKKLEKSLSINLSKNSYFKGVDYNSSDIIVKQKSVNSLDEGSNKIGSEVLDITKKIERTLPNVDRSGKRGNIKFDVETNSIMSRNNNVNIEIIGEKIKIKGLSIEFDIYQGICIANLINRFKYKYPNTHGFYFGSRLWSGMDYGIYKSEGGVDTQIIDLDTIKEKFPSIIDKNNDVRSEFINYINSI